LNVLFTLAGPGVDESLAVITTVLLTAVVGVPVMDPVLGLRLRPAGRLPVVIAHVYGATPPLADKAAEYGWLTVAEGNADVVSTSWELTVMTSVAVAVWAGFDESVTCTFTVDVPAFPGVPLITPVALLRPRPPGRLPEVTDQV
jgi:hypothetical protein